MTSSGLKPQHLMLLLTELIVGGDCHMASRGLKLQIEIDCLSIVKQWPRLRSGLVSICNIESFWSQSGFALLNAHLSSR